MTIGTQIANARQAKCWSQAELAHKIGVTSSLVQAWEGGQQVPTAAQRQALEQLLALSLNQDRRAGIDDPHAETSRSTRFLLKLFLIGVPGFFLIAILIPVVMLTAGDRYTLSSVSLVVTVSVLILAALILLALRFHQAIRRFLTRHLKKRDSND
ncbi:helix-turn-helix domain-containing protein [Lapidilactobacillus salsurivasis]